MKTPVLFALLAAFATPEKPESIGNDFSKPLAPPWSVTSKEWKVDKDALVGAGGGALECSQTIRGDFTLTFEGWSGEKTNFEVKLFDKDGRKELYTFAFLGRYHSVLDGPKSCILKGNAFVAKDAKMWIFPGRAFEFEVRRAKNQFQMFLNGEIGPAFVDDVGPALDEFRLQILASPEGSKDAIRIDDVRVVLRK